MIAYQFAYEQPDDASLESELMGIKPEFFTMLDTPPTGPIGAETERYRPSDAGHYMTGAVRPPGTAILVGKGAIGTLVLIAGLLLLAHLLGVF